MGYKLVKFNFVPCENEQIDAVIKVPKEPRSIIHGVVLDEHNKPIEDAVVKLYKQRKAEDLKLLEPITHAFTDHDGNFIFGPLCPNVKYVIKVWVSHVKIREIIVSPEPCDLKCDGDKKHLRRGYKDNEECAPFNEFAEVNEDSYDYDDD